MPLGRPWHEDFEVDITEYLQDPDGQPLRQRNVPWFYANELADLEVTLRSLVTATSLIPVEEEEMTKSVTACWTQAVGVESCRASL